MKKAPPTSTAASAPVPLEKIDQELTRRRRAFQGEGECPVVHACMSNLVIYCDRPDQADAISQEIPGVVSLHPSRVLLLIVEAGSVPGDLNAAVGVRGHLVDPGRWVCSEQITLRAQGLAAERLPYVVRGLLIGDLPTNLWWASWQPPALGGSLLYDFSEHSRQIIFDSLGWREPARDILATASWLDKGNRSMQQADWRVASDLNWRRLKPWRRFLAQALDPVAEPGAIQSVTEVVVEHGPHAVIQAWLLVSWLASRLGWQVDSGKVQPAEEFCWQFIGPQGRLIARIRRLLQGSPEIHRLRISCQLDGHPGVLNFLRENERRLAVLPEGVVKQSKRTVTVHSQHLSELVAYQLSDREDDPVFRESMTVACTLAQSVSGQ